MKRLNKFLKIAILGLLSLVAVDGAAQKTVTYEFTGRNGTYFQILLKPKPIDLKVTGGTAPAGVQVKSIEGIHYEEDQPEADKINDVDISSFAGIPFIPIYMVDPQSDANITFNGFKYEITDIQWWRACRVLGLTSTGKTWATNYASAVAGDFAFDTSGDTYRSGWGPIATKAPFLKGVDEAHPLAGLTDLHVKCESKLPGRGIVIDKFQITYWEPEITISDNEPTLTKNGAADGIIAKITDHKGAFADSEIVFESSDKEGNVVQIVQNATDGSGAHATVTPVGYGSAIITAKILVNGQVASKAQYKVTVPDDSPRTGFYWEADYGKNNSSNQSSFTPSYNENGGGDTNSGISYISNMPNQAKKGVTSYNLGQFKHDNGGNWRALAVKMSYNIEIPAYTNITRQLKFKSKATVSGGVAGAVTNTHTVAEVLNYDNVNPSTAISTPTNGTAGNTGNNSVGAKLSACRALVSGNGGWGQTGTGNSSSEPTVRWEFTNSMGESSKDDQKYIVLTSTTVSNSNVDNTWSFTYEDISNAFTYDYYAYITFVCNPGEGNCSLLPQTINVDVPTNKVDTQKGGIAGEIPTTTKGKALTKVGSSVTRTGFVFVGWKEATDNGDGTYTYVDDKVYKDGEEYCPYDDENACGKGPRILVAQWKQEIADPTTPGIDTDEVHYYIIYANDGVIVDSESKEQFAVANIFTLGQVAPGMDGSHPAVPVTTSNAQRVGYNFIGCYDSPDTDGSGNPTGNLIFNTSGVAVNDGTYVRNNKWAFDDDAKFYAMWRASATPLTIYSLTLEANGGTRNSRYTAPLDVVNGDMRNNNIVDYTPTAPSGKVFVGWFYEEVYGTRAEYEAAGNTVPGGSTTQKNNYWNNTMTHDQKVKPGTSKMVFNQNGESLILTGFDSYGYPEYVTASGDQTYWTTSGKYNYGDNLTVYAHYMDASTKIAFHEGTTSGHSAVYHEGATAAISTPASEAGKMETPGYTETDFSEVILSRSMKKDKWNTICFPCYIDETQVGLIFEEVKQYSSLKIDDDNANMKFKTSKTIIPGNPYFVKLKKDYDYAGGSGSAYMREVGGLIEFHISNSLVSRQHASITYSDVKNNETVSVSMIGDFDTKLRIGEGAADASTTEYLYLQGDQFFISGGTYNVSGINKTVWGNNKGFRCYFTRPKDTTGGAKAFTLHLDLEGYDGWSGEDALEDISAEGVYSAGGGDIYDLSGRQLVGKPQRGLYIVNGRKYISK